MSTVAICPGGFALDVGGCTDVRHWWALSADVAEAVVVLNLAWMSRSRLAWMSRTSGPGSLAQLGVRYEARAAVDTGTLTAWPIRLAPAIIRDRRGNCLDLSCYHAARLRWQGHPDARVLITVPTGAAEGHAVVIVGRHTVDPMELV